MNNPTVTVVIPTYNRGRLLRRAVKSVLDQTYEQIQVIVVDDGSDIPANEVLTGHLSSVEVITHEENRGGSAARNTGIRNSSGKYIAFLDDDDYWKETKIEKQVEKFRKSNGGVGLVYSWIHRVNSEGERILVKNSKISGYVTKDILLKNFVGSYSCVMVKRSAVDKAGLPDTRFDRWQDWEWYFRLSSVCEFEYVPEFLVIQEKQGNVHFSELKTSMDIFLDKNNGDINEFGTIFRYKVLSNLFFEVGSAGVRKGEFNDSRKLLLKSIGYYPLNYKSIIFLLLSFSNNQTISVARQIKRWTINQINY